MSRPPFDRPVALLGLALCSLCLCGDPTSARQHLLKWAPPLTGRPHDCGSWDPSWPYEVVAPGASASAPSARRRRSLDEESRGRSLGRDRPSAGIGNAREEVARQTEPTASSSWHGSARWYLRDRRPRSCDWHAAGTGKARSARTSSRRIAWRAPSGSCRRSAASRPNR